ncbi:hypothetical protein BDV96DRAFT_251507 [Lophiotrema nucula]|uniref:Nucleolar protein Dnt1-like N-terminal domain-containing protein n=1 Tax=Lophiotrema nucula TaxID=690887 RepID=A0A6A5YPN8_9PLEO|nr:hypothetical protein BDV96DRAFT_251507 [Lophiotrema nucula]
MCSVPRCSATFTPPPRAPPTRCHPHAPSRALTQPPFSMRLYVEVLPLELEERVARSLPAVHMEALKGRSFAMPVQLDDTFEQVWSQVEERFKRNYLTPAQAAAFEIKKLQDANSFDLDLSDTVGAIFEGETNPVQRLIKVVPALLDRHFSVPITSNLRPVQAHKRACDTIGERSSKRRRRAEDDYDEEPELPGRPLESERDQPLPSTEGAFRDGDGDRRARRSSTDASLQYVQDTHTGFDEFPPIKDESPELGLPVVHTEPDAARRKSVKPPQKTYGRAVRTPNGRRNTSPAAVVRTKPSRLQQPPRSAQKPMSRSTPAAPVEQWCKWCGLNRSRRERAGMPLHCDGRTPCNECSSRNRAHECEPKRRRRGLPTPRPVSTSPAVQASQTSSEIARQDVFERSKPVDPETIASDPTPKSSPPTDPSSASVTPIQDVAKAFTPTETNNLSQLARSVSTSTSPDPNAATPPSAQPGTSGQDVLEVLKPGRLLTHSPTPSTSSSTTSDSESSGDDSEPEKADLEPEKPGPKLSRTQPVVQKQIRPPPAARPPPSSLPTRAVRSQFQTVREQLLAASQPPPASTQQQKVFDPRTMSLSRLGRPNPLEGDSSDDESSNSSNSDNEIEVEQKK